MDISVIIPLFNESDSLSELHSSLKKVMTSNSFSYEVIFIDDGSSDNSWDIINDLYKENQSINALDLKLKLNKINKLIKDLKTSNGKKWQVDCTSSQISD